MHIFAERSIERFIHIELEGQAYQNVGYLLMAQSKQHQGSLYIMPYRFYGLTEAVCEVLFHLQVRLP